MDPEKLDRREFLSLGRGRGKIVTNRGKEANHKRLLNTENKLRVGGGGGREGKVGDGH